MNQNMNKKKYISMIPIMINSIATNTKIQNEINKLYLENNIKAYQLAKNSRYYNSYFITSGGIDREIYCKRILGVMLLSSEDEKIAEKYHKIIIKGFKKIYKMIDEKETFIMSEIIKKLENKGLLDEKMVIEEFNATLIISFVFARQLEKEIDYKDEYYISLEKLLIDLTTKLEKRTIVLTYERLIRKSSKENLKKLDNMIKRLLDYLELENINILDNIIYTFMKHKALGNFTNVILNIIQTENIDIDLITYKSYISPKDVKVITQLYSAFYQNQNREEFSKVILTGLLLKAILKDYKKTKEYYFKNNKENLYIDIEEYRNKINDLNDEANKYKSENKRLSDEIIRLKNKYKSSLEKDNIKLKNENLKLKSIIEELKKDKEDLNILRNFLFESEQIRNDEIEENIIIPSIKAIIIGGHENWQQKLQQELPSTIKFIETNSENYDVQLLNSIDYVFFNTEYMNHAIYYKTINYCRKNNIQVGYLNKTCIELTKQQISKFLEKIKFKKL